MNVPWKAVYLIVGLLIGIGMGVTGALMWSQSLNPPTITPDTHNLPLCAKANYFVSLTITNLTLAPHMNSDWTQFSVYWNDGIKNYNHDNPPMMVVMGYYAEQTGIWVGGNGTVDFYGPSRLKMHLNLTESNHAFGTLYYREMPSFRFFNPNNVPIRISFSIRIDQGEVFYQSEATPWGCSLPTQMSSNTPPEREKA